MTSLSEATKTFAKIGCLSFGGPAAQIALMHREFVDQKKWLSEKQFLSGLSFCMLLPGPEAMQLATYAGWRMHGVKGGLAAGLLFVIPGALVILALATIYVMFGTVPLVETLFLGIKAAVLAIVLEALVKVAKRAFKGALHWGLAVASFVSLFVFDLPFPLVIAVAALIGWLNTRDTGKTAPPRIGLSKTLGTVAIWLIIWWAPVTLLALSVSDSFLPQLAVFFSKLAAVTFGGAYAVLAYMGQEVVQNFGWLSTEQMIDGLGLAETTPGPLILVTEFVGFIAGYNEAGFATAFAAAGITLWVTFVPCFLWIFAGAPYIEWMSDQPKLSGALSAITAAVVGVIANLSIWFGLHVLFETVSKTRFGWMPELASLNLTALGLSIFCAYLLLRLHLNIFYVLIWAGLAAWGLSFWG